MDSRNTEVGKRINELRKTRGYTREKLSELSDISVQFLAEIEKGRKNMTVTTLRKVSRSLLVTTDFIVNGTENNDENTAILAMLENLSPENRRYAEKLLTTFIEAINANQP